MQQLAEEMAVLAEQRLIEAELMAQGGPGGGWGLGAEQGIDRIPRSHPQQQEHQAGDQPQHQRRQGQAGAEIAQQLGAAAHGWFLPAGVSRRCSSPSSTRPEPSKRGVLSWGRAQATGAVSHTGR